MSDLKVLSGHIKRNPTTGHETYPQCPAPSQSPTIGVFIYIYIFNNAILAIRPLAGPSHQTVLFIYCIPAALIISTF
jgi:hypothetical protein